MDKYLPITTNNIVSCNTCAKRTHIERMEQVRNGDHVIVNDLNCIVVEIHTSDGSCVNVTAIYPKPNDENSRLDKAKIGIPLDGGAFVVSYACPMFNRSQIVQRAEQRFARNGNENNEFATWCVTNRFFLVQGLRFPYAIELQSVPSLQNMHDRRALCDSCYERFLQKVISAKWDYVRPNAVNKGDIVSYFYYWFWHDAVVMEVRSNNRLELAHFGIESVFYPMRIMKETVKFEDSKTLAVYKYDEWNVYSPDEVVARAESRRGEKTWYFALNKSAEFAKWCKVKMPEY